MSFTVQFNYENRLPSSTATSLLFNLNWSAIPFIDRDCDYELSFCFSTESQGGADANTVNKTCILSMPTLGNRNCFLGGKTTTTQSGIELGIIKPYAVSTNYALASNFQDNPPIVLKGIPTTNEVVIEFFNAGKTAKQTVTNWVLMIHFKKI
jgi:hypothetical protein